MVEGQERPPARTDDRERARARRTAAATRTRAPSLERIKHRGLKKQAIKVFCAERSSVPCGRCFYFVGASFDSRFRRVRACEQRASGTVCTHVLPARNFPY